MSRRAPTENSRAPGCLLFTSAANSINLLKTRVKSFTITGTLAAAGVSGYPSQCRGRTFGTKDHRMRFEALFLDGGRTFVHVSYSYSDSVALRLAGKAYFATLGRGKVGFTVTGTDINGNPVYIGGPRGAIERNAVRYYFGIQSLMNTLRYPEKSRFSMRTSEWYDLTTRYRKQLFDLDKKDYLKFKTKEHMNQVILQRSVGTGPQ